MTESSEAEDTTDWYSNDAATFGDRVAWAREALGLTIEELSRRTGVTLETLIAWEGDMAEPRANRLQMLSGMLNVSMSWLLTGEGEGPDVDMLDATGEHRDVLHVLGELRTMRTRLLQDAEKLAVLEKQLRRRLDSSGDDNVH